MAKAVFPVKFETMGIPDRNGIDKVEFFFSANPGEPPRPLKEIISGGELARFMLALKTIECGSIPVLIFDEIDSGIGGHMGEAVGRKLAGLSEESQVIVITHLPQIAAFADAHYHVSKSNASDRTVSDIKVLSGEARLHELAVMLAGPQFSDSSLKAAGELIRKADEWKKTV